MDKKPVEPRNPEQDEFLRAVDRLVDPLYHFALRMTRGDQAQAEDLVTRSFLRCYRSWRKGQERAIRRVALMRTCRQIFLADYWDARHPGPTAHDPTFGHGTTSPSTDGHQPPDSDGVQHLIHLIEELSAELREVVVLHDLEGLNLEEVAEVTGLSDGDVEELLEESRLLLSQRLGTENLRNSLDHDPPA